MTELRVKPARAVHHDEPIWLGRAGAKNSGAYLSADEMLWRLHYLVRLHHATVALPRGGGEDDARFYHAGRMEALALAGSIDSSDDAVDLELLIRDVLRPFQFGDADGIHLQGPTTYLRVAPARLFILALHELVTNAIKFGSLGGAGGRHALHLEWRHHAQSVDLTWRETGVAILRPIEQVRAGFGCAFLQRNLPALSGGDVHFDLLPGGVRCVIEVPFASWRADLS